jgi:hypothetical protein
MSIVDPVNTIDGNQYLVNNDSNATSAQSTDFNSVYQNQSDDLSLDAIFNKVANEYGVNVSLLKAVAQTESGFDTNAVSGCGAMGIMQLMPSTAASLGVEDPFDAEQSITGGAKMLGYLLDDYNGNVTMALAAYNAGSGSVQKYGGVPPYQETLNYIKKINNILGGALDNDATTINASQATNLTSVQSDSAPDTDTKGSQNNNSAVTTVQNTSASADAGVTSSSSITQQVASLSTDNRLFSYDDYVDFLRTYKENEEKATASTQSQQANTDAATASISKDTTSNVSSISNANAVSAAMLRYGSPAIETIMKTSPQSLYEAQASVISPIVSKILEL